MAATLQQSQCSTARSGPQNSNPKLKRLVYNKYRELLGSYNNQAQAYIDTLPAYMVHRDNGFNLNETPTTVRDPENENNELYGSGQRMPAGPMYEAPACVQNAMMTKDKKPFTYTPGGIDLSQIKSERMAKRLARNAQAEGVGAQRSPQPQSPGTTTASPGSATASMGAAALGMPFQVLPPTPPAPPPPPSSASVATSGKNLNGNAVQAPLPPPPPPQLQPMLGKQQNFEPPPIGFRPQIKIPPNPMSALRKVPPPIEKNNFWKDEYVRETSKSPLPERPSQGHNSTDSAMQSNGQMLYNSNNDRNDAFKKPSANGNGAQYQQNNSNSGYSYHNNQAPQPQVYTPTTPIQAAIPNKTPQPYVGPSPSVTAQQMSPKFEFRSVAPPQSPTSSSPYNQQSNSPRWKDNNVSPQQQQQQRAVENSLKFAEQQQQQQQSPRTITNISPLVQQQSSTPSPAAQPVPWRSTRANQQPQQQQQPTIYNNVEQKQKQQQQPTQFNNQISKPTNVGSLYIAPLTPPVEPQAQHMVRQQMQQQQQQQQQQQLRQTQPPVQQLRWLNSQPVIREQPEWARPEDNGNVVPSSLNRIKSPPPPPPPPPQQQQQQYQQQQQQQQQQQKQLYQQQQQYNNSYNNTAPTANVPKFGTQGHATTGLRLQINNTTTKNQMNNNNAASKERIIPIQLEQSPSAQAPSNNLMYNTNNNAPGYIIRSPNQFVDQGYSSYAGSNNIQQQQQGQRVMSPSVQQLNAPRMVQQQQQQQQQQQPHQMVSGPRTHIIPIAIEGNGPCARGPISKTPVTIPNDQRNTSPIQSKSFRILQKITDTANVEQSEENHGLYTQPEAQLQKPQYARPISDQKGHRNSPNVEQMKRMQIAGEQDYNNQYIPPNEQYVAEPKKYTGSAIPSRSFKILQAMTTPENVDKQNNGTESNKLNDNYPRSLSQYHHHYNYKSVHENIYTNQRMSGYPFNSYYLGWPMPLPGIPPTLPTMLNSRKNNNYSPFLPCPYLLNYDPSHLHCNFPLDYSCSNFYPTRPTSSMDHLYHQQNYPTRRASSVLPDIVVTPTLSDKTFTHFYKGSNRNHNSIYKENKWTSLEENLHRSSPKFKYQSSEGFKQKSPPSERLNEKRKAKNEYDSGSEVASNVNNDIVETASEECLKSVDKIKTMNVEESNQLQTQRSNDQRNEIYKTDNEGENCSSVTVRLPLKFSFRRSSKDENITTVVVGRSEIKEKNNEECRSHKELFSQKLEENFNSCNVTVTLPSTLNKLKKKNDMMEFLKDDAENDIKETEPLDFFATLMATKKEAQKIKEKSVNYWGQSQDNPTTELNFSDNKQMPDDIEEEKEEECIEDVWADREDGFPSLPLINKKESEDNFWSTFKEVSSDKRLIQSTEMANEKNQAEKLTEKKHSYESISSKSLKILEEDRQEIKQETKKGLEETQEFKVECIAPTEYPEEPREVDTDEEIDFWAELQTRSHSEKDFTSLWQAKQNFEATFDNCKLQTNEKSEVEKSEKEHDNIMLKKDENFTRSMEKTSLRKSNEEELRKRESVLMRERVTVLNNNFNIKNEKSCNQNCSESLNDNNSMQRSDLYMEEIDSDGIESESFPELRKMTSYQRAATHSRLFKLLQEEVTVKTNDIYDESKCGRKKIIHDVSITRKQQPGILGQMETRVERRQRLGLPECNKEEEKFASFKTICEEALSPPTNRVTDQLVNELIESLLSKNYNLFLKQVPKDKLQATAKRVLEDELNNLNNNLSYIKNKVLLTTLEEPIQKGSTVRCPRVTPDLKFNETLFSSQDFHHI